MKKGDIVKYQDGYYRITTLKKNTVNLGSIFGKTIYYKNIPLSKVKEAHSEWYAKWSQSETYQSM